MHANRLLNVARACRESPHPLDMGKYGNDCGTPACAFGNYCARVDLQDTFRLDRSIPLTVRNEQGWDNLATHSSKVVLDHFGITAEQSHEIFGDRHNTGGRMVHEVRTAQEAADWIERRVAERQPAPIPASVRAIFTMTPAELAREFA